jgi:hypothetical protein
MKATAVIAAYNEAARIGRVLSAVTRCGLIAETIVVDDGSWDGTGEVAARYDGAVVVRHERNRGKGAALWTGVSRASNEVVVFLDADLVGLTPEHVCSLVGPVLWDEVDMTVGQFRGGNWWLTLWQRIVPAISGQRALRASHFRSVPRVEQTGFGLEVALTRYARRRRLRTRCVYLPGMRHVIKEDKLGFTRGLCARFAMYGQMARWVVADGYRRLGRDS